MRNLVILLCLLLVSVACNGSEKTSETKQRPSSESQTTTVYLVRHAEKGDGEDPDLTEAGRARAERLREILAAEPIVAVYTTAFNRTRQTATPTADHHGVPVKTYDPGNLVRVAETIMNAHEGGAILVVGHSNTTPELAGILSEGKSFAAIGEDDYANLLVVRVPVAGRPTVERRTY